MGASSPGPSLIVILRHAVADGRNAGINAAVGHGIGIFIYALVSAIGLSFILTSFPKIFSLVQIFGGIFLLWIGFQVLREGMSKRDLPNFGEDKTSSFILAFLFSLMTAWVFVEPIEAFFLTLWSSRGKTEAGLEKSSKRSKTFTRTTRYALKEIFF